MKNINLRNKRSLILYKIRDIYYRYRTKYMKYIPIIGIIILFYMYFQQTDINTPTTKNTAPLIQQFENSIIEFIQSFDFSDKNELFRTIILLITIWTGYKYWLNNFRIIRRNQKLVDKVIFIMMLLIFSVHIKLKSTLGQYFDFGMFLLALYFVIAGTWLLAKIIDSLNLESDLYCWGLRLVGGVLILFGWILFAAGGMAKVLTNFPLAFDNIFWITGLCIMGLGAFSEFRSFRRQGVFVYMR